jgi:predicted ATPase
MVMARIHASDPSRWKELASEMAQFGVDSGLFEKIRIRQLGRGSDPFQILLKVGGPDTNLIDVGYGVSQALPILAEAFLQPNGTTFLLQQPEVHLHPKAQASLGSFLCEMVNKYNHRYVVETHSDHLIDRIRMDVRDGHGLQPDQVSILYFEKEGPETRIHPVNIDDRGNVVNAPPGYRSFFLEEERRFFLGGK